MLIFVYGTLRRGGSLHYMMERIRAKYCGTFTTESIYTMISLGGCPALVKDGISSIVGEVYDVVPNGVIFLDGVEGRYRRQIILLRGPSPAKEAIYAYFMPIIECGDWMEYVKAGMV